MNALETQLIEDIASFSFDPLKCALYSFPWLEDGDLRESSGPRAWQKRELDNIGQHLRSPKRFQPYQLAIASGHGIGKSSLIGMIIHWAMSTCADCKVILTANTDTQLRTKTWPEVSKWFRLAINSHWFDVLATSITAKDKGHERSWRTDAIPWSEHNTEPFAGAHNQGKRLLVIYDEASAIADKLWEVTEGALTDENTEIIWIAFGNPTKNTGRFRECFGRYKHRWQTHQIDSRTVEGTNKEQIAKWIEDYGEDSDFVRVRVRGEFPRAGSTQFVAGDVVAAARIRICEPSGWKVISVDVARFGDDQTIIGLRQGMKFEILERLRGKDTFQTAQYVIRYMQKLEPRLTIIDADGLGAGTVDAINNLIPTWFKSHPLCKLHEFHGGATPSDSTEYFNLRAEMWGTMREWLKSGDIPDDPALDSALTSPEYFFSSKNQIQLEKKDDMKKRGLASPDEGDCLAMSFAEMPRPKTYSERLSDKIATTPDPLEQHLIRLRETERRNRLAEKNGSYWE